MAIVFGSSSSVTASSVQQAYQSAVKATGDRVGLLRTDAMHFDQSGLLSPLGEEEAPSFEDAMLQAMNGVNDDQLASSNAIERMLVDPDSIEAHDVTIAMAKANMSLNITRTVLDRVVRAWKDLINTR